MNDKRRILVVDDEQQITRVLHTSLSAQGYEIRVANDGEMALEILKGWTADLVVTDLYMPRMDGIELCRQIRLKSRVPIVVLSVKNEERTKVRALDAGADDYVSKPFGMQELMARIRANLRRSPDEPPSSLIEMGDFRIDVEAHLVAVNGCEVRLTPTEFDLLLQFARHPGKVLRHRALLAAIWGPDSSEQAEYLRVFIGQLRKKLESPGNHHYILTEPWVGYRFEPAGAK
jgi:two-component system, OmpR family, KDP operon response regulator KdpE